MAKQYQIPGGPYVNVAEDGKEYLLAGYGHLNQATSGAAQAYSLACDAFAVSVALQSADLISGIRLGADAFSVSASIQDATLTYASSGAYTLALDAFTVQASFAESFADFEMTAGALAVQAALQDVSFVVGYVLPAEALAVQASFADVTFAFSGAQNYLLACDGFSVSAAFADASLFQGLGINAEQLAVAVQMAEANLVLGAVLDGGVTSVTASFGAVTLTYTPVASSTYPARITKSDSRVGSITKSEFP